MFEQEKLTIHLETENLELKEDLNEARKALEQNNSLHDLINMKKIRKQNKEKILIKEQLIGVDILLKIEYYSEIRRRYSENFHSSKHRVLLNLVY